MKKEAMEVMNVRLPRKDIEAIRNQAIANETTPTGMAREMLQRSLLQSSQ